MAEFTINRKFRTAPAAGPDDTPSDRRLRVAEMFGIGTDETHDVTLYDDLRLDVRPGDVVFVTGPSGSGKTVLLRDLVRALAEADPRARVVDLADADPLRPADAGGGTGGDRGGGTGNGRGDAAAPVIDLLRWPLEEALRLVSLAGLADAFLLLRTPAELSDGQRYRLRLALALERVLGEAPPAPEPARGGSGDPPRKPEAAPRPARGRRSPCAAGLPTRRATGTEAPRVLVADEFCSTLDRLCARAVAYRVRRLATAEGVTVLAASAHDDLLEDLDPDVLIVKHAGAHVEVHYADPARGRPDAAADCLARGKRSTRAAGLPTRRATADRDRGGSADPPRNPCGAAGEADR